MSLTPEQLERAAQMRTRDKITWAKIASQFGVTEYVLRCAVDKGYHMRQRALCSNAKRRRQGLPVLERELPGPQFSGPPPVRAKLHIERAFRAPAEVLAERDRRMALEHASLTAALLGDPLPGRSALDKRKPHLVSSHD